MGAEIAARGGAQRGERGRRPEPAGDRRRAQARPRRSSRATPASCTWPPASARRSWRCSARRCASSGSSPTTPHASVVERNLELPALQQPRRRRVPAASTTSACARSCPTWSSTRADAESAGVSGWDPAATALLGVLPQTARGPAARGDLRPLAHGAGRAGPAARPAPAERAHRRRLQALEHRLSASPCPRRSGARWPPRSASSRTARPETAAQVLSQLVAPAREAGGAEAGDALAQAARAARAAAPRGEPVALSAATRRDSGSLEAAGRADRRDRAAARRAPDTVPSGFPSLDRMLGGGFRRQDLVVLAGDVGSGKSALALGIAVRAARAGMPTLFLSGEMSPERVLERALALEGRAPIDDLRQGRLDAARARRGRRRGGAASATCRSLLRPLLGASFRRGRGVARSGAGRALAGGGLAAARAVAAARGPSWTSGSALAVRALKALAIERNLARARAGAAARASAGTGPTRAPRSTTSAALGSDQADRGSGAGDLSGGDVPAGPGRGRRDGAHRRQEPQRADRIRGPVLLSRDGSGSRTCWTRTS